MANRKSANGERVLEVVSVGSGSCGNALLLRTAETTLLVDCGVGIRRLNGVLASCGLHSGAIDALLISHEHIDHSRERHRFATLPVLATRGTAAALAPALTNWMETRYGRPVSIGDAEIVAIPVSHDAAEPSGFLIRTPAGAVSVLTDLGSSSGAAIEAISESRLIVLEANHDESMVRAGSYPAHLQRRILSPNGHLSNRQCGEMLLAALKGPAKNPTIWLAHLSASNNTPVLARRTVVSRLASEGLRLEIATLPRREASGRWTPDTQSKGATQLAFDQFL